MEGLSTKVKAQGRTADLYLEPCFLVLCKRHEFNRVRVPGAHRCVYCLGSLLPCLSRGEVERSGDSARTETKR